MNTKQKTNAIVYFILGISGIFFLLSIATYAHAGTIYVNEKSYAHQSNGTFQSDVFASQPVTLLNVSGISFETSVGVTVYCDGLFIGFSKGLPMNNDMVLPCDTVDVYDAGVDGVTTGNVVFSYLEGTHTASEIISGTAIPTQSMPQNLYYGFTLFFAVMFFMVWVLRKR